MTQLGRIEYALAGGHVNTDAIDNSAGVDTSDHEVNIKVLLDAIVAEGDLTYKQRNQLLVEMTDEVGALVLRDNYEQNVLLGNARVQALSMLPVHRRFIRLLEKSGELNRALEFLPRDSVMDQRMAAGLGLTSPEFSVLVAYAKITLKKSVLASTLPDEAWFTRAMRGYFPRAIGARYEDRLQDHPLRREIVTTRVVNDLVNRGGITFVFRATEESGATAAEITRAYTVVREVFGFAAFWRDIESLDGKVPTEAQTALYLEAPQAAGPQCPVAAADPSVAHRRRGGDQPVPRGGGRAGPADLGAPVRHGARAVAQPGCGLRGAGGAGRPGAPRVGSARRLQPARDHRHRRGDGAPPAQRGTAVLRPVRALRRRPHAHPHHRPAAGRPLAGAGAVGAALRPLRRAGQPHPCGDRRVRADGRRRHRDQGLGGAQRRGPGAGAGDARRHQRGRGRRPRGSLGRAADDQDARRA
jgi:hypothetical protein